MSAAALTEILAMYRIGAYSEEALQEGIAEALDTEGWSFEREVILGPRDRVDFLLEGGVGIEVKIDGTAPALIRQLHRYAQHARIHELVVVTNRARLTQMPAELNGKPVHVCSLLETAL